MNPPRRNCQETAQLKQQGNILLFDRFFFFFGEEVMST